MKTWDALPKGAYRIEGGVKGKGPFEKRERGGKKHREHTPERGEKKNNEQQMAGRRDKMVKGNILPKTRWRTTAAGRLKR